MSTISKAIQDLEDQKRRIDSAIRILRELDHNGVASGLAGTHRLSPEGRRKIAEAQKRRWARERVAKKKTA
ncbi:MAG: hypothetical protein ACRD0Y_08575 [Terriglobales bacterium]